MEYKKWKDTDNFTNMIRSVRRHYDIFAPGTQTFDVRYNAKIKLHGTNAQIQFDETGCLAGGRNRELTIEDDNFGFARWVKEVVEPAFLSLDDDIKAQLYNTTLHGEWAGPGIQKDVAVSQIPQKMFFVFCAEEMVTTKTDRDLIVEPMTIEMMTMELQELVGERFNVLPWFYDNDWELDLFQEPALAPFIEKVNEDVEKIGVSDPYISLLFDVDAKGEGLVFYDRISSSEHLIFKAKSEEHRTTKTKSAVAVNPKVMAELSALGKSLVTNARLEQGYQAVTENETLKLGMESVALFLKWVANDVQKECQAELDANGKTWKDVAKTVNGVAVQYFKTRIERAALGLAA